VSKPPEIDPKPGQWVRIRAKVVPGSVHPDDALVELWSHNEQYLAHVRRSDIVDVVKPPWPDEPGESAIVIVSGVAYQRREGTWYAAGAEDWIDWDTLVRNSWAAGQDGPVEVWEP
jgi:hypothetical protein